MLDKKLFQLHAAGLPTEERNVGNSHRLTDTSLNSQDY
jgi:hypothetical protein